jgi:hypothetical protein
LLRTLLDRTADEDVRLDIVTELRREVSGGVEVPGWASDDAYVDALVELASDPAEGLVGGEAAEALAWIWLGKGWVDRGRFERLTDEAKAEVRGFIELNRPDLRDGVA